MYFLKLKEIEEGMGLLKNQSPTQQLTARDADESLVQSVHYNNIDSEDDIQNGNIEFADRFN